IPGWAPPKAQEWVGGQITRFPNQIAGVVAANYGTGGASIAVFKAAGTKTGRDQLTGRQFHAVDASRSQCDGGASRSKRLCCVQADTAGGAGYQYRLVFHAEQSIDVHG